MGTPVLILASQSPRRRQMLAWTGLTYSTLPADLDEGRRAGEDPRSYVSRLAAAKARAVAQTAPAGAAVLAADTIVADGDDLLGKPADDAQARAMLLRLRGRTHQVYTALALLPQAGGDLYGDLCVSAVAMRAYTDEEMDSYIRSGDPLDKAGAYAIQNGPFHPVTDFSGCFASVMGLPLCHLLRTLRRAVQAGAPAGLLPPADVAQACQAALAYACPVSAAILAGADAG
jgi:MAF protein